MHFKEIHQAAGLLAFTPETNTMPYKVVQCIIHYLMVSGYFSHEAQSMYSRSRWDHLSQLFVSTHHALFSLPSQPLLHVALSAGLSSLKTPSCHSSVASSSSNAHSSTTSVCPICSTELNELARNLPYAHHTKSHVESDPVVLPNGRIYGRARLLEMSAKVGVPEGQVKDPTTGDIFDESLVRKVYIS